MGMAFLVFVMSVFVMIMPFGVFSGASGVEFLQRPYPSGGFSGADEEDYDV